MDVIHRFNDTHVQELHTLYQSEWWTRGRTIAETQKCIDGSQVCIGVVDDQGSLQGFARVLTDYTFKALIFDLIVSNKCRGEGLGDKLIGLIKQHQKLQSVKHFELYCLPEMFAFYERHGFSGDVGEIKLMRLVNA